MEANDIVWYFSLFVGVCAALWIGIVIWSYHKMGE